MVLLWSSSSVLWSPSAWWGVVGTTRMTRHVRRVGPLLGVLSGMMGRAARMPQLRVNRRRHHMGRRSAAVRVLRLGGGLWSGDESCGKKVCTAIFAYDMMNVLNALFAMLQQRRRYVAVHRSTNTATEINQYRIDQCGRRR